MKRLHRKTNVFKMFKLDLGTTICIIFYNIIQSFLERKMNKVIIIIFVLNIM